MNILRADRLQSAALAWDYPFGWPHHQVLTWAGLLRYGFTEEAERLAYKWIYTILKSFVDFNGVVVESYGLTESVDPQRCYQNNSDDQLPYFKAINTTGYAASNGSVIYGLQILNAHS
ncbi:Neutral trehalase [Fusarium oxysporum f. sp. phaseoli]